MFFFSWNLRAQLDRIEANQYLMIDLLKATSTGLTKEQQRIVDEMYATAVATRTKIDKALETAPGGTRQSSKGK